MALPERCPPAGPADGAPALAPARSAVAGDVERLRAIVDAHFDFIWRSLRRLGLAREQVDDAAQKVFFVALRRADAIQPGCERAFLFATARRVAADMRRTFALAREQVNEQVVAEAVDHAPSAEDQLDDCRARALLDELLDEMADDLRTVFVLFEMEGMTSTEIASLLDLPVGTVASRLRRAREQFHVIARRLRARLGVRGGPT